MRKHDIRAIALAIGFAFSAGAMAQSMTKEQYKSGADGITADHKAADVACGALAGNARDICKAQATGKQKVARAELEARYKPSEDARYKVHVAVAEADYAVAKERCDDKAGNIKDVCLKEAKAAEVAAKADATANMKTAKANAKAAETSTNAANKASDKGADARKDAASDKRDADYAVAKEKCDAFSGDAKGSCLNDAKARYGKS